MSLRWLTGMGGGKTPKVGIRRKAAPLARRELAAEIDAHAVAVRRLWSREVVRDLAQGAPADRAVIARVEVEERRELAAWLDDADDEEAAADVRTDWILFPSPPEAILIGVIDGGSDGAESIRFNLRFAVDRYRRQLERLARSGRLGLTTLPLQIGGEGQLQSRCVFIPIQAGPLRAFLRELPPAPVV
jgi:hypothetical protein